MGSTFGALTNPGAQATQAGGISGPQQAYATYLGNQQKLKAASDFATSGTGISTNETQAANAGNALTAQTAISQSDADAAAMSQFINNQVGQFFGGLGGLLGAGGNILSKGAGG